MQYKDRHARVERECEWCGEKFMARVERVNAGQGRFCSLAHANLYQTNNDTKNAWGIEKGKSYWDGKKWVVHYREGSNKVKVLSYQRWWWLVNKGEIPPDTFVVFADGDGTNLSPDNFVLRSKKEHSRVRGENGAGSPHPSIAGANSKWWRGGSSYDGYPTSFSKPLKKRIKIRDNFTCQCCYSQMESKYLDVHHIDRDISHNEPENLVTVCKPCHKGIHGKMNRTNKQIRYYQSLLGE